jgi:transposase
MLKVRWCYGRLPCMNPTLHNWKEARRLQAWHLKQHGWSQRQMAEAIGVSEGAVSQWITRAREAGSEALRRRPPPGAPRWLSTDQLARLPELLHRGPAAYGFRGALWTRTRIAAVIRLEFGVSYHPRHVGRLCQAMRWTPQKPTRRARQPSEAAIVQWREETWPAIKGGGSPAADDPLHRRIRLLSLAQCRSHLCAGGSDTPPAGLVHP